MWSDIWAWILDLFFPGKCILCQKLLEKDARDFCWDCRFEMPLFHDTVDGGLFIGQLFAVFSYEKQVRESLLRYKFNGMAQYANSYGPLIAASVQGKGKKQYDGVTWVPVSRQRRRKRGYDQSYLLAKSVAKELNLPLIKTLHKVRNNDAQSTKITKEQRKANVLGVYTCKNREEWGNYKLLLLDDIWTTGATVSEAARTLLTGGAGLVDCAVVAVVRER